MIPENVLVIYKKSIYQLYFDEHRQQLINAHNVFADDDIARFAASHESHCETRKIVGAVLRKHGVRFKEIYRASTVDYSACDFVISVGGDGTFLEAARKITDQPILGVNSDPERSIGAFCSTSGATFEAVFETVLAGKFRTRKLHRMSLVHDGVEQSVAALNDIMIAHASPAAMSKYRLMVGDVVEEQRGSGLWICTAAGSTGGILSAGGRKMALGSKRLQYRPRELFRGAASQYPVQAKRRGFQLPGGIVAAEAPVTVESRMREGYAFVDGAHFKLPLPYNSRLEVLNSKYPLKVVRLD